MALDMIVHAVEDNLEDAHQLAYLFKRYGVTRFSASFGFAQGLKDLEAMTEKPDLILVDWGLPQEGGVIFIHEAKKVIPFEGVKFELITGMRCGEFPHFEVVHKDKEELEAYIKSSIKAYIKNGVVA